MFGLSFTEILIIGIIALIVIGPERLPKVARTVGHLLGRAQRYVTDVKTDIQREIEADQFKDLKDQVEDAARSVKASVDDAGKTIRNPLDQAQDALKEASDTVSKTAREAESAVRGPADETMHALQDAAKTMKATTHTATTAATAGAVATAPDDPQSADEQAEPESLPLPGFESNPAAPIARAPRPSSETST